jgi:hypothetical protein
MILPEKIIIQLCAAYDEPLQMKNILCTIETRATYRNDIHLFPFASNENGIINIFYDELKKKEKEWVNFGLMDHAPIETAGNRAKIRLMKYSEIITQLKRADFLPSKERLLYLESNNILLDFERSKTIRSIWDGKKKILEYQLIVYPVKRKINPFR